MVSPRGPVAHGIYRLTVGDEQVPIVGRPDLEIVSQLIIRQVSK
jgi:hypothetical protein